MRKMSVFVTVLMTSFESKTVTGRAASACLKPARFTLLTISIRYMNCPPWPDECTFMDLCHTEKDRIPSTRFGGKGEPSYACTVASGSSTVL